MKVEKITQSTAQNQISRSRNLNLTGFGQNQTSSSEQVTSFNNKKSNEAIRNQFLTNLSFEGHKDCINLTVDRKYGPTIIRSTSGGFICELPPDSSSSQYDNSNQYIVNRTVISTVYHAKLENEGIKSSGSSPSYVVKDAITQSQYFYNGSHIKENYPIQDGYYYNNEKKSVYFSDPGERMDERTPHADYVVYAPGAYYKERSWYEKL